MITNANTNTDKVLEYKTESMRLLEAHTEIIESQHYSKLDEKMKAPTAFLIENTETWLNEDANLHGDLQYYKEMLVPIVILKLLPVVVMILQRLFLKSKLQVE